MPTYEYRCHTCGIEFEAFQSMSESALKVCPKESCPLPEEQRGTGEVERRISAGSGLVFKGSGFYITDYKVGHDSPSSGSHHGEEKKTETSPPSTKPADATPATPSPSSAPKTDSSPSATPTKKAGPSSH